MDPAVNSDMAHSVRPLDRPSPSTPPEAPASSGGDLRALERAPDNEVSAPDETRAPQQPQLSWQQADTNLFLQGNFVPQMNELDVHGLQVEGTLPRQLNGTFLRNGPNPQFEPPARYHTFDGDGMVHALRIEDGKASYRNRWVVTPGLRYERKVGHGCFSGMAEFKIPPVGAMREVGMGKNPGNTHVISHGGKIFALAEAGAPFAMNERLETIGSHDFGGKLKSSFTAHPHVDPVTGEMFAFGYSFMSPSLRYFVVDPEGEMFHQQLVALKSPVMMHDFMITEDYAIFLDAPAVFDPIKGFTTGEFVHWRPEQGTRLGVMPRYGHAADIRWFQIDNGYIFHFFNAYQEDGSIIFDGPLMDRVQAGAGAGNGKSGLAAIPHRFEINLESGYVKRERICDTPTEFSQIDPRRTGRKHHYGYGYGYDVDSPPIFTHFRYGLRFDLWTGQVRRHDFGVSNTTGELLYAPNPESESEEDGWLISMVYDRDRVCSEFVVLSAGDIEAPPLARVRMPHRIPYGFHGSWVPAE